MSIQAKVILCFFLLTVLAGYSQTEETKYPETVLIKAIETGATGITTFMESKMIIVNTDNQVETKDLRRINLNSEGGDGMEYNMKKIQTEIQLWQNKGFKVKSTSSVSPKEYTIITIIVLQKD